MDQSEVEQNMNAKVDVLVRKGGFEPPRLTAPPPQDGASASSATSARGKVRKNLSTFYKSGQRFEPRAVSATSTAPVSLGLAPMQLAWPPPKRPRQVLQRHRPPLL